MTIDDDSQFEWWRWLVGLATAGVAMLWAPLPLVVQILVVLMAIDLVTGLLAGFAMKSLNFEAGWRGITKKALILLVVAAATVVEPLLGGVPVGQAIAGFYCAVEGLSCMENAARAGVPIPTVLSDALSKLKEQTGDSPRQRRTEGGGP